MHTPDDDDELHELARTLGCGWRSGFIPTLVMTVPEARRLVERLRDCEEATRAQLVAELRAFSYESHDKSQFQTETVWPFRAAADYLERSQT